MKKTNNKGFTIVELVIVIAVIAILAAVLIPTFSNIIKKANLSNDQQNVRNMNTALAVEVIPDSQFPTAGDAINALYGEGWNLGKLETYSKDYDYAYSLENNRMYLLDEEGNVVYPQETIDKSTLWGLYKDERTSAVQGIKKYVALTNITNSVHFNESLTAGDYTIDLNNHYINVESTVSGVKVENGILIKGAISSDSTDSSYTVYKLDAGGNITTSLNGTSYVNDTAKTITFENLIFENNSFQIDHVSDGYTLTFDNCVFYNTQFNRGDTGMGSSDVKTIFKNCKFIDIGLDADKWAIFTYSSLEVTDCEFINLRTRGAIHVNPSAVAGQHVKISGCTFNGTAGKYPMIRFGTSLGNYDSVEVSNCTFKTMDKATYVIGQSGSPLYNNGDVDGVADKFAFSNNHVDSSCTADKYSINSAIATKFGASIK